MELLSWWVPIFKYPPASQSTHLLHCIIRSAYLGVDPGYLVISMLAISGTNDRMHFCGGGRDTDKPWAYLRIGIAEEKQAKLCCWHNGAEQSPFRSCCPSLNQRQAPSHVHRYKLPSEHLTSISSTFTLSESSSHSSGFTGTSGIPISE